MGGPGTNSPWILRNDCNYNLLYSFSRLTKLASVGDTEGEE